MSLWDLCIRRPVFTAMIVLAPVVLGLASLTRLNVDLMPNVDMATIVVTTSLPGAASRRWRPPSRRSSRSPSTRSAGSKS